MSLNIFRNKYLQLLYYLYPMLFAFSAEPCINLQNKLVCISETVFMIEIEFNNLIFLQCIYLHVFRSISPFFQNLLKWNESSRVHVYNSGVYLFILETNWFTDSVNNMFYFQWVSVFQSFTCAQDRLICRHPIPLFRNLQIGQGAHIRGACDGREWHWRDDRRGLGPVSEREPGRLPEGVW